MAAEALQRAIETYFAGERYGGLAITGFGVAGLIAAGVLGMERWELRPFAIVLGVLAIVELAVGISVLAKVGARTSEVLAAVGGADAASAIAAEAERIAGVQRTFQILVYTWVGILAVAPIVAVTQRGGRFWVTGIAAALALHVGLLLAFDLIADRRTGVYRAALERARS